MRYLLPLRRNFKIIDYGMRLGDSFIYRDRGINSGKERVGEGVYLYEDVKMRGEEETTYIRMITEGKRSGDGLEGERERFGKIAILSNNLFPKTLRS
ncbi:MAG: hypothetical protein ACP5KG_13155 [Myxococcota bacterium]